jgi:hypothetical protein
MDEAATSLLDVAAAASIAGVAAAAWLVCVASFWSIAGLGQILLNLFFPTFIISYWAAGPLNPNR